MEGKTTKNWMKKGNPRKVVKAALAGEMRKLSEILKRAKKGKWKGQRRSLKRG